MCVSLVVENDPAQLAASLGLTQLSYDDEAPARRVEARAPSMVLRLGAGGRIVAETMSFNPYVVRHGNISGDLWAHTLLGESHGLLVVRSFSEWTSGSRLVRSGMASVFEINCAFNRFAPSSDPSTQGALHPEDLEGNNRRDRIVLGNFAPTRRGPLLVPVLFDVSRKADATHRREFAVLTREPYGDVAHAGAGHAPVSLTLESALIWLHAASAEDPAEQEAQDVRDLVTDFDEVLEDDREEGYQFSLFKSA